MAEFVGSVRILETFILNAALLSEDAIKGLGVSF